MDIFGTFAVDETKEKEGVWFEFGDAEFLVARSGNARYLKALAKSYEKNKKLLDRNDEAAEKLSEKLLAETLAETILLGWRGDVSFKGEPLTYSRERAAELLLIKDFRVQILKFADDFSKFKAEQEAAQQKN